MAMKEILTEDRRLVLLRSLLDCGDSANESVLQTCLQAYGHKVSRDVCAPSLHGFASRGWFVCLMWAAVTWLKSPAAARMWQTACPAFRALKNPVRGTEHGPKTEAVKSRRTGRRAAVGVLPCAGRY